MWRISGSGPETRWPPKPFFMNRVRYARVRSARVRSARVRSARVRYSKLNLYVQ